MDLLPLLMLSAALGLRPEQGRRVSLFLVWRPAADATLGRKVHGGANRPVEMKTWLHMLAHAYSEPGGRGGIPRPAAGTGVSWEGMPAVCVAYGWCKSSTTLTRLQVWNARLPTRVIQDKRILWDYPFNFLVQSFRNSTRLIQLLVPARFPRSGFLYPKGAGYY